MKNVAKVVLFSLVTIAFFAGFANFGIPEIKPAPPPEEMKLGLGSMSMDAFVALGAKLFNGKGTCTLCHNALGRAPMLDQTAAAASERLTDARYKGSAKSVEEYLRESMVEPSAYVVAGFGKAGTSDTESPMPSVTGGAIGFSEAETAAVIAYLQKLAGAEITVRIPAGAAKPEAAAPAQAAQPGPAGTPGEVIAKYACGACHKVADQAGAVGPDLTKIGATRDREYLRRAILDPNADVAKGFAPNMMPNVYRDQMYVKELELLVDYLAGLK